MAGALYQSLFSHTLPSFKPNASSPPLLQTQSQWALVLVISPCMASAKPPHTPGVLRHPLPPPHFLATYCFDLGPICPEEHCPLSSQASPTTFLPALCIPATSNTSAPSWRFWLPITCSTQPVPANLCQLLPTFPNSIQGSCTPHPSPFHVRL